MAAVLRPVSRDSLVRLASLAGEVVCIAVFVAQTGLTITKAPLLVSLLQATSLLVDSPATLASLRLVSPAVRLLVSTRLRGDSDGLRVNDLTFDLLED